MAIAHLIEFWTTPSFQPYVLCACTLGSCHAPAFSCSGPASLSFTNSLGIPSLCSSFFSFPLFPPPYPPSLSPVSAKKEKRTKEVMFIGWLFSGVYVGYFFKVDLKTI